MRPLVPHHVTVKSFWYSIRTTAVRFGSKGTRASFPKIRCGSTLLVWRAAQEQPFRNSPGPLYRLAAGGRLRLCQWRRSGRRL